MGKGTKSPGEQNTARFFSPDCFYGPCVCLCICLTQTPWKCPAFLDTGKEANTLLRRKTKFLKDNNFFFYSKEVCRNLHGNILCYVVYNLYSLAQMKENSLVFCMISLRWTEEKYFEPLRPHLCLIFLFHLLYPPLIPSLFWVRAKNPRLKWQWKWCTMETVSWKKPCKIWMMNCISQLTHEDRAQEIFSLRFWACEWAL